ncbi:MAG: DUF4389 domain-containing protein [Acidimicrobiales bacterium]
MAAPLTYPVRLDFDADRHITRWHPLVQWLLAIPHLLIAQVLSRLRSVLTFLSFFTVLFTERIPRALFDMIAMTYRYEWRPELRPVPPRGLPAVRLPAVGHRRRTRTPHERHHRLPGAAEPLEAALQVVPGHPPLPGDGRASRRLRRGGGRRVARRALHR